MRELCKLSIVEKIIFSTLGGEKKEELFLLLFLRSGQAEYMCYLVAYTSREDNSSLLSIYLVEIRESFRFSRGAAHLRRENLYSLCSEWGKVEL